MTNPHPLSEPDGQPDHPALLDLSVRDFLFALSSPAPTPGGGAAAALSAATAAALVEMTANLTIGRERYAAVDAEAREIAAQADALQRELQLQVVADARAYNRLSSAYRLPRTSEAETQVRLEAIQVALGEAAQVPLEVAHSCARLLALCVRSAPLLNPGVISDVLVGAQIAAAALAAAAITVEVNLNAMRPGPETERVARRLAEAQVGAEERLAQTCAAGRARMPRRAAAP